MTIGFGHSKTTIEEVMHLFKQTYFVRLKVMVIWDAIYPGEVDTFTKVSRVFGILAMIDSGEIGWKVRGEVGKVKVIVMNVTEDDEKGIMDLETPIGVTPNMTLCGTQIITISGDPIDVADLALDQLVGEPHLPIRTEGGVFLSEEGKAQE